MLPEFRKLSVPPPRLVFVRDLEEFEGPILSEYRSEEGGNAYLEKWCARDETTERFLLVRSDLRSIEQYMAQRISMRLLLENGSSMGCNIVDRRLKAGGGIEESIYAAWLDELPGSYLPSYTALHDENLRPHWERTTQSFLLGDDWSGGLISAIEKNFMDVTAFNYFAAAASDNEAQMPEAVRSYQYRGGYPVWTAYNVMRSYVPQSHRARSVGVSCHSPGILSIDAKTDIVNNILRSVSRLERAKPYYDLVQSWAKQDVVNDPFIPPAARRDLELLANVLDLDLARLMSSQPDAAEFHVAGKLLTSYFRKLLKLARPPGDAEFLGVDRGIVPTEVLFDAADDDE